MTPSAQVDDDPGGWAPGKAMGSADTKAAAETAKKARELKAASASKAQERKKRLGGIFAFGGADDDAEEAPKAAPPKKKPLILSLGGEPKSTAPAPGHVVSGKRMDAAELGIRYAQFKASQMKNGRRVYQQMPDDLRDALAAMQAGPQ